MLRLALVMAFQQLPLLTRRRLNSQRRQQHRLLRLERQ
jgi:hypothetical protein